jgi:hypothetical protein
MDTDPRSIDAYKAVEANLNRLNKGQKETLRLNPDMSSEDRDVVLDYYRGERNRYYAAFNSVYNAVKRGE